MFSGLGPHLLHWVRVPIAVGSRDRRGRISLLVALIATALCAAGCGGSGAKLTSTAAAGKTAAPLQVSYPTRFTGGPGMPVSLSPLVLAGTLTGTGGVGAGFATTLTGVHLGGAATCARKRYSGPLSAAGAGTLGTIDLGIRQTGLLVLDVTHLAAAYRPAAPPVCSEMSGTYRGTEQLAGQAGSWRWLNSVLSLTPTSTTGSAASPVTVVNGSPPRATLSRFPAGFPTTYDSQGGGLVGLTRTPGYNTLSTVDALGSRGGTQAISVAVFREHRIADGTVRCAGQAYTNAIIDDPKVPADGVGLLGISGWGTATLHSTGGLTVFGDLEHGPPQCSTDTGTYAITFTAGPLLGTKTGRYTTSASGTLTLH
jgi:hypothetical protein